MSVIYLQSWKQCALPVIATMALCQLIHLGTWCTVTHCWYQWTKEWSMTTYIMLLAYLDEHSLVHWYQQCVTVHHVLKCMSCHKAVVVITGRVHCFHDCIYITLILLLWDIWALSLSWITYDHLPYIYIYIYIYIYKYIYMVIIKHSFLIMVTQTTR